MIPLSLVPQKRTHKNRAFSTANVLMPPFAAPYFCTFRQIKKIWRKRRGAKKEHLINKACALYALQLPTLANQNKRNKAPIRPASPTKIQNVKVIPSGRK